MDCADSAIKYNDVLAHLRFGYDSHITPSLALMDVKGMKIQESDPERLSRYGVILR